MKVIPNTSNIKYVLEPINGYDPLQATSDNVVEIPILGWIQEGDHISAVTLNGIKHNYVVYCKNGSRYEVTDGLLTKVN